MPEIIRRDAPRLVTIDTLDFAPQYAGPPCCRCKGTIPAGHSAVSEAVQLRNRGIAFYYWHPACWQHAEECGSLPVTVAGHADR